MSSTIPNSRIVLAAVAGIGLAGLALVAYTLLTRKKETTTNQKNEYVSPNVQNIQPSSAFGSIDKTDKKIVEQLRNRNYQLPLASHDWPELIPLGPDFVALGDSMWKLWSEHGETSENVSLEVLWKYVEPVLRAHNLEEWLYQFLVANPEILFEAMKEIAESYLNRAPEGTKEKNPAVPLISLMGTNRDNQPSRSLTTYTPKTYLASGNASRVWIGLMPLENGTDREVVLKQINETQKDSAIIEYNIAQKLLSQSGENSKALMHYMDLIYESPTKIWLVLEKVRGTEFGLDLTEYLSNGFFQAPGDAYRSHARQIACDLLLGLRHIAYCRVILRDLKADNVLIHYDPLTDTYQAKWTDFGLAVDLDAIRRPLENDLTPENVKVGLIGFWYDSQKLVPRPKWVRRRPPENCFKNCERNLASYDIYMLGVVFCSAATGIDWAHIEKKEILQKAEKLFGSGFAGKTDNDVLKWDISKAVRGPLRYIVLDCFKNSFGAKFGEKLFEHTLGMLEEDWNKRPTPHEVYTDVFQYHT